MERPLAERSEHLNLKEGESTPKAGAPGQARSAGQGDSLDLNRGESTTRAGHQAQGKPAGQGLHHDPAQDDGISRPGLAEQNRRSGLSPIKIVLMVFSLVACLALVALGMLPRIEQGRALLSHTKNQLAEDPYVSVTTAEPGPEIEEFALPGSTQAIQDAVIYARVDGYLKGRYVNIGDLVQTGQVMADIDTPELDQQVQAAASSAEQAQANLENARQALEKAHSDEHTAHANVDKAKTDLVFFTTELGRYKLLAKQGAVSLEDCDSRVQAYNGGISTLEALKATEESAKSSVNSAKAAVHVAEAALNAANFQYHQYMATRSFKKVTAPFDGIVTKRNVDPGALITSGSNTSNTLLFEVAKTDVLRIYVYVPEQYVPYIHDGEQTILNFQEYPGHDFNAVVSNVSGGVDPDSRTLQVEIHINNPDHNLLPGMYAQVRFQAPALVRQPRVPATTLQTRADGCFLYTVDKDQQVHMHKVEIGRDLGGQFEVTKGISTGDTIVVSPSDELREGMKVNPVEAPVAAKTDAKTAPKSK